MTAKEYLNQIYIIEARYEAKKEQARDMRLLAESAGAIRYDRERVQTSPTADGLFTTVLKIIESENDAIDCASQLFNIKETIISQIINLDDANYMRILCLKYVHHNNLTTIADKMHFTYQYTKELHKKALDSFEETYPEIKDIK